MTVAKVPRVALSLPADTHATLAKLASLQRRPKSAIATELLVEMTPALDRIAKLLEAAMQSRTHLPGDTAARLQGLEELLAHTAAFGLDRLEAAVSPPQAATEAPRRGARRRPPGH